MACTSGCAVSGERRIVEVGNAEVGVTVEEAANVEVVAKVDVGANVDVPVVTAAGAVAGSSRVAPPSVEGNGPGSSPGGKARVSANVASGWMPVGGWACVVEKVEVG